MGRILTGGLGWLLCCYGAVTAEELQWRPAKTRPAVTVRAAMAEEPPAPGVQLGRPVPLMEWQAAGVTRASYQTTSSDPWEVTARAQSGDGAPPPPAPANTLPGPGDEHYNCAEATTNPGPGNPFLEGCRRVINGIPWAGGSASAPPGGRCLFQSDHCFDSFISPVTNPFLFEDPRALTEVRPIFIYQLTPDKNYIFKGGSIEFFGAQGRVALTDRWSIVLNKLGWLAIQPNDGKPVFRDANGFAEINIGPKYTFLRNEPTGTLGALGVTFEIPTGSTRVFQDTGSLSIVPYISMGQSFGNNCFHALGTFGYSFSEDDKRAEYFFLSLHLDYNFLGGNHLYPFIEMNWFDYTSNGRARPLGFEGQDLANIGSGNVAGEDNPFTIAFGARYKFSECVQTGLAAEFPINGRRDLLEFRLTADLIFRY